MWKKESEENCELGMRKMPGAMLLDLLQASIKQHLLTVHANLPPVRRCA
ncbi:hypothetical protein APHMUC_1068 [Anaplasma phagocytophilum str. ApMUC09]|uniref:Uncharacterized protein n=1 Tax=Anaplasma phagocytophilum str. ApMUC09 TaxID=1359152 RepID=A0A0F3N957_ANAPH|nr:hypothetical protein APHMUC_1068 [Anaplasma phagocytophilum str. ApMUC09]